MSIDEALLTVSSEGKASHQTEVCNKKDDASFHKSAGTQKPSDVWILRGFFLILSRSEENFSMKSAKQHWGCNFPLCYLGCTCTESWVGKGKDVRAEKPAGPDVDLQSVIYHPDVYIDEVEVDQCLRCLQVLRGILEFPDKWWIILYSGRILIFFFYSSEMLSL